MAFLETMAKLIERYNSFFTEGIVNTLIIACGGSRWRTSSLSAERR